MRSSSGNGNGLRSSALIALKMAVLAPMPRARVMTAIRVNPGRLIRFRIAYRMSFRSASIVFFLYAGTRVTSTNLAFVQLTGYWGATTGLNLLTVNDPAVFKSHNPIAVGGVCFGVRHLHDGRSFIVQAFEHFHDLFALCRMKISSRLISQNDSGTRNHRTRNSNELLLTT